MNLMKGLRLGPEEMIKRSLEILELKFKLVFTFLIKLQLLSSHFFSKYCLVIKRVFALSRAAVIAFQSL